jgi:hypothetical protein
VVIDMKCGYFNIEREFGGIAFSNLAEGRYVYFPPGDDAAAFERLLEDYQDNTLLKLLDIMKQLWSEYDHVSEEI